ncbi:MAG: hypothetical protein V5B44_24420 [Candidatus Accumulibacter necessarius]|uniref:hypothetical protein n=1 Tax=Candidatus Accumulibacter necessarius TaxID=2954386 RepID=UPI002FC35B01
MRLLQLGQRLLQALGDLRQLALQQQVEPLAVLAVHRLRQITQVVQRLQQVLHVMRQASAGFVDRPQIAHLLQLASAQLGDVVFVGELRQQMEMPDQRRAQLVAGVQGEQQGLPGKSCR